MKALHGIWPSTTRSSRRRGLHISRDGDRRPGRPRRDGCFHRTCGECLWPDALRPLRLCDQPEGVRSRPGDLDLVMYSLRRFCRLAARGNPSVILPLWCLLTLRKQTSDRNSWLSARPSSAGNSGNRFLGYLLAQKRRLTGERSRNVTRPELVAKHGFDTKSAMHALRFGFEGIESLTERQPDAPRPRNPI